MTSQGAESAMNQGLANKIRCVEPLSILKLTVETEASTFYTEKVLQLGDVFVLVFVLFACFK